jgi:hypothetical protein
VLALGMRIDPTASSIVLIGAAVPTCREALARARGLVAIGDAAARVLEHAGFGVTPIRPEHGRLLRCIPTNGVPGLSTARPFTAMRYATLAVEASSAQHPTEPNGWEVWLRDEAGRPLAWAHAQRSVACLLICPESLLSDPAALDVLHAALAFVAAPAR